MCSRDWLKLAPVRRWLMQRQRNFAGLGVALIEPWSGGGPFNGNPSNSKDLFIGFLAERIGEAQKP